MPRMFIFIWSLRYPIDSFCHAIALDAINKPPDGYVSILARYHHHVSAALAKHNITPITSSWISLSFQPRGDTQNTRLPDTRAYRYAREYISRIRRVYRGPKYARGRDVIAGSEGMFLSCADPGDQPTSSFGFEISRLLREHHGENVPRNAPRA